jgi:hypothetical protein
MGDPLVVSEPANTIIPIIVAIGAFLLFGWRLFPAYRQIWRKRRARRHAGSDLLSPDGSPEHLTTTRRRSSRSAELVALYWIAAFGVLANAVMLLVVTLFHQEWFLRWFGPIDLGLIVATVLVMRFVRHRQSGGSVGTKAGSK